MGWYFLPNIKNILEIVPGYGSCTQFLKDLCYTLYIADLNENCIQYCKERFKDSTNIEYFVNDGKSLEFIDDSVDLVFSWDSLVHVEIDVIEAYLDEACRILTPGGIGFIHHSNFGELRPNHQNLGMRALSVSGAKVLELCQNKNLQIILQEFFPNSNHPFADCITLFRKNREVEEVEEKRPCITLPRIIKNGNLAKLEKY